MRLPRKYEWRPALYSGALAVCLPPLIKLLTLPRLMAWLSRGKPAQGSAQGSPLSAQELARITNAVVQRAPRYGIGQCLLRSLVLYRLLRRAAYRPALVIGVNMIGAELRSHCWIEADGVPLAEKPGVNDVFQVVYRYE